MADLIAVQSYPHDPLRSAQRMAEVLAGLLADAGAAAEPAGRAAALQYSLTLFVEIGARLLPSADGRRFVLNVRPGEPAPVALDLPEAIRALGERLQHDPRAFVAEVSECAAVDGWAQATGKDGAA